jgi:sigma-B regulation protein RsbU (phosphoserine phosphatase)
VGPALLSISVLNVLRSQTLPATDFKDPTQVLTALNKAFQMIDHKSMFFTMWYGVYQLSTRQLDYAGAGHPAALVIPASARGADDVQRLVSQAMMVGAVPDTDFPRDMHQVQPGDRLYLYSDGVFEVPTGDGSMWKFDDFVAWMSTPAADGTSKIDALLHHVRGLQGSDTLMDDFSMLEMTF